MSIIRDSARQFSYQGVRTYQFRIYKYFLTNLGSKSFSTFTQRLSNIYICFFSSLSLSLFSFFLSLFFLISLQFLSFFSLIFFHTSSIITSTKSSLSGQESKTPFLWVACKARHLQGLEYRMLGSSPVRTQLSHAGLGTCGDSSFLRNEHFIKAHKIYWMSALFLIGQSDQSYFKNLWADLNLRLVRSSCQTLAIAASFITNHKKCDFCRKRERNIWGKRNYYEIKQRSYSLNYRYFFVCLLRKNKTILAAIQDRSLILVVLILLTIIIFFTKRMLSTLFCVSHRQ